MMIVRKNLLIFSFLVCNCFVVMLSSASYNHSSILEELRKCFETKNDNRCQEMIVLTERMQLSEYYKGNLKCQTSILGLQTELIRSIYFNKNKDYVSGKTIPLLIKNC